MRPSLLAVAILATMAVSGAAAVVPERVLVPIAVRHISGGFGSLWTSTLWVHNTDAVEQTFDTKLICPSECFSFLGGNQTLDVPFLDQPGGNPGLLVLVDEQSDAIRFVLRVQDESRQASTWGTDIPVIRERDALTGRAYLLDVPTDAQFRVRLRVYSFADLAGAAVRVRAFDPLRFNDDLGSVDLPIAPPSPTINTTVAYKPGYAEIPELVSTMPGVAKIGRIGIEITPLTPGLHYCAFVSVTHDSTQHFTVIKP